MKEYDSLSDNEKCNMLASVANLYYNAEMTQNQIAERFYLTFQDFKNEIIQWSFRNWVKLQHTI